MANAVRKLQADKAALLKEGRGLLDKAANENRLLTDDEKKTMQGIDAKLDGIDEQLATAARFAERELEVARQAPANDDKPEANQNRNPWYAEADRLLAGLDANFAAAQLIDKIQRHGGSYADAASAGVDPTSMAGARLRSSLRRRTALGCYMIAVANAAKPGGSMDSRLIKAAASGANELVPSDGGFLVNSDFANDMEAKIVTGSEILSRVDTMPISANANSVKVNYIDETSRATGSRWGGVQVYWAGEADAVTAKKPKFSRWELELEKLFGLFYATSEVLQDAALIGSIADTAFTDELRFTAEDAVINGDGVGKPMGILNANCTVEQAIEGGQTIANTNQSIHLNTLNMLSHVPARNKRSAVWLINSEMLPHIASANFGGSGAPPIFMPGQNFAGAPFSTVWGYPLVEVEYCSAVGTVGDIILADLSQYAWITKGGIRGDSSMHVRFLNDEQTFRWVWRINGNTKWRTSITRYKGSAAQSPFITLGARS